MTIEVENWISAAPPNQQVQLRRLRSIILELAPDSDEAIKWNQPCYTQRHLFCYLQRAKKHVTMGFQNGARLNDPSSLLSGDGKLMRHINFAADAEIEEIAIKALIRDALRVDLEV